jgi:hypothetical protein
VGGKEREPTSTSGPQDPGAHLPPLTSGGDEDAGAPEDWFVPRDSAPDPPTPSPDSEVSSGSSAPGTPSGRGSGSDPGTGADGDGGGQAEGSGLDIPTISVPGAAAGGHRSDPRQPGDIPQSESVIDDIGRRAWEHRPASQPPVESVLDDIGRAAWEPGRSGPSSGQPAPPDEPPPLPRSELELQARGCGTGLVVGVLGAAGLLAVAIIVAASGILNQPAPTSTQAATAPVVTATGTSGEETPTPAAARGATPTAAPTATTTPLAAPTPTPATRETASPVPTPVPTPVTITSDDGKATLTIPAAESGPAITITAQPPSAFPPELRGFPSTSGFYALEPADRQLAEPGTFQLTIDLPPAGIDPDTQGFPVIVLAHRASDGTWSWLDDQEVSTGTGFTLTDTGTLTSMGGIFGLGGTTFVKGTPANNSGFDVGKPFTLGMTLDYHVGSGGTPPALAAMPEVQVSVPGAVTFGLPVIGAPGANHESLQVPATCEQIGRFAIVISDITSHVDAGEDILDTLGLPPAAPEISFGTIVDCR